jgi:hypothetical protein
VVRTFSAKGAAILKAPLSFFAPKSGATRSLIVEHDHVGVVEVADRNLVPG